MSRTANIPQNSKEHIDTTPHHTQKNTAHSIIPLRQRIQEYSQRLKTIHRILTDFHLNYRYTPPLIKINTTLLPTGTLDISEPLGLPIKIEGQKAMEVTSIEDTITYLSLIDHILTRIIQNADAMNDTPGRFAFEIIPADIYLALRHPKAWLRLKITADAEIKLKTYICNSRTPQ